jgi:rubrerythrin
MTMSTSLDILKNALLLETRGRAFYSKVAEQAENQAVKKFFNAMAAEEAQHIAILSEQFKTFQAHQRFTPGDYKTAGSQVASQVLTTELKGQIAAAAFEAAAISAAIAMEEKAIAVYAGQKQAASDAEEKALYGWLADWEREHLNFLVTLDREIKETVWNDNSFWPF